MVRWNVRNEAIKANGSLDTRRNAKAKGELMTGWSDYALDRFMAPKLSKLTVYGAEELSEPIVLIPPFILNSVLVVKFDEAFRINAFNLIRRVEQAHYAYEHGRAVADEAGRDSFWLARWLSAHGVEAHMIHPSSVPR